MEAIAFGDIRSGCLVRIQTLYSFSPFLPSPAPFRRYVKPITSKTCHSKLHSLPFLCDIIAVARFCSVYSRARAYTILSAKLERKTNYLFSCTLIWCFFLSSFGWRASLCEASPLLQQMSSGRWLREAGEHTCIYSTVWRKTNEWHPSVANFRNGISTSSTCKLWKYFIEWRRRSPWQWSSFVVAEIACDVITEKRRKKSAGTKGRCFIGSNRMARSSRPFRLMYSIAGDDSRIKAVETIFR